MPKCKNCGETIRGVAYSNRARTGYLDKKCRDIEEKKLNDDFIPRKIPASEFKKMKF